MNNKLTSCVNCGKQDFSQRQGHARDNINLIPLECNTCGLVSLSSTNHIDVDFYTHGHMNDATPVSVETLLKQDEEDSSRRLKQFLPFIKQKSILDIGCGVGGFLLEARKEAKNSLGIELNQTYKEHYQNHNLSVFEKLEDLPKDFIPDTIFLFHVLEHIENPQEFLEGLFRYCRNFKPKVQIVIEVPHANDALLTYYQNEAFSKFTYWSCHLYLYTAPTLQAILEKSGFALQQTIYFQRYPLSNHLYWLSKGKPGGQIEYTPFNDPILVEAYNAVLEKEALTDTLIGIFSS